MCGLFGLLAFDPARERIQLVAHRGPMDRDGANSNLGQPRRSLDTSRAHRLFGFKAQVGFEEGLRQTIEWYVAQQQRSA
jgi:nucleoside-diphosphate-sugar epimerase